MFFAFTTPVIAPVLTFTVFALVALRSGGESTLDTTKVFTSLSLFGAPSRTIIYPDHGHDGRLRVLWDALLASRNS